MCLILFCSICIFSSTFWEKKNGGVKQRNPQCAINSDNNDLLTKQSSGLHIYHLTAFCECCWRRAEQTILCDMCAHTHTHRHEVCCCARMCVCAYPNPHRPLHNDTGLSIAIHLVRLTYLSFCPRAFSLLSAGLHGGNNWLQLVSNFPRWPFKLCAAGQVINIPSESWTPAGTKVKAALLLIGLCDNYANLAFLRWYYIWLYSLQISL